MKIQKIQNTPPKAPNAPNFKGMHVMKCDPTALEKILPIYDSFATGAAASHCSLEKAEEAFMGLNFTRSEKTAENGFLKAIRKSGLSSGLQMLSFPNPAQPLLKVMSDLQKPKQQIGFHAVQNTSSAATLFDEIVEKYTTKKEHHAVGFKTPSTEHKIAAQAPQQL